MRHVINHAPPDSSFDGIALFSHFQPIYSLPLQRQVGYEALLRGATPEGELVSPFDLFAKAVVAGSMGALDRRSHATHLHRATGWLPERTWLFLNVTPANFVDTAYARELALLARISASGRKKS